MNIPVKMSLDEFYGIHGCPFSTSGDSLDKCRFPHGRTDRQQRKDAKQAKKIGEAYMKQREEIRNLYNEYVSEGKIIPKTKEELMIERANGHPDNESVQAARRMCEKRGIDWRQK